MEKTNLSENQINYLIEAFKRWGVNPILQDDSWQVEISKEDVEDLIEQRYLVHVKRENEKIKYNLSIKGQELARAFLSSISL